jgi:hypothetical protein
MEHFFVWVAFTVLVYAAVVFTAIRIWKTGRMVDAMHEKMFCEDEDVKP